MTDYTDVELFAEIERLVTGEASPGLEPNTITTSVVMDEWGIGRARARRILRQLVTEGVLVTDWVSFTDDWGRTGPLTGYRYNRKVDTE